jgi:hypothetical protein
MYYPWWESIDEDGSISCHWYDEDGLMICHWYMMKMNRCGFISIWCIARKMYRWLTIVLSCLIKCTNGWTPMWSPYCENPHGNTLCGLSYPRRMFGGPMLVCGIMRWRSMNLLVKLSYMDSSCHAIYNGIWNVT